MKNTASGRVALVATVAAVLACAAGCRAYEPKPVDWDAELSTGVVPEIRLASPNDAATLALVGNRRINALRLKAANAASVAKASGWWEDPALGFDLMRILDPSDHPFIGGGSLAFTIPLSGALSRETKAAEAYAHAEAAEIRAAERTLAADARKAAIRLAAIREHARILSAYDTDPRIVRARENVEKLHTAGEVSAAQLAGMHRAVHHRRHALMEAMRDASTVEIALLRLLGLRPGACVKTDFACAAATTPPPEIDVRQLTAHPEVAAALARLDGSEAALDAEIRRQYPDLTIGPAYANEEGLDRLGLTAGLTLPIWNRNRKGIAEAEGARDEARLAAIDVWRALVCDAAAARADLVHLLAHPSVPASERREVDRLADAGELTPLDYLTVREEILDQKLAEADWKRDVALAAAELKKFD